MFSETRYAMNGDLHVAYRASREGARDTVLVPAWFSNCEYFPEQPPVRGWIEAMTSLGRLILFDQPGTGAADPVTPGALPTLELRADRERGAARPRTVALMMPLLTEMDVRAMLPTVRVPTLVLHHTDDPFIPPEWGKDVADRVSGARYVELRGRNVIHFYEPDWRASFQEIAEFLTGQQADVADDRVLATVLFTDIVDSTRRVAEIGDRDWHSLRDAHDAVVRSQLSRFRGREVNASGDGFLAMFDGPQLAIRCAMAIRDAVRALGIEVRAGLHTGEGEIRGDDIGGIAVHIGARVSALAGPNQVLVSSTLRDPAVASA